MRRKNVLVASAACLAGMTLSMATVAGQAHGQRRTLPQAAPATPQAATQPVTLASLAEAALKEGRLEAWGQSLAAPLAEALADVEKADLDRVTELAALRRFASYFGPVADQDRDTLAWLLTQPQFLRTLALAVHPEDEPSQVPRVLAELRKERKGKFDDYADLATAVCVVWDKRDVGRERWMGPADAKRAAEVFRHLCSGSRAFRHDPRTLPWELQVYSVGLKVTDPEIAWATQRYQKRGVIGGAFFDVPYDDASYYGGRDKAIADKEYTLPNLVRYGGVCAEQAQFAEQVSRSLGVPATYVRGTGGGGGVSHAWVGYLERSGRNVKWDFTQGRYTEHLYWSGQIEDPQTHEVVSDGEVALSATLVNTPAGKRLASMALLAAADAVPDARRTDLLRSAVNLSPGNRRAWIGIADLAKAKALTDAQRESLLQAAERNLVREYPEFAVLVARTLADGIPAEQQLQVLERLARSVKSRPDLVGQIRVIQGDLVRMSQPDAAMRQYWDVLTNHLLAGPIVLEALDRVDSMLRGRQDLTRLADVYKRTWTRLPRPDASARVRTTPWYQVGERYAEILEHIGRANDAHNVRSQIAAFDTGKPGA